MIYKYVFLFSFIFFNFLHSQEKLNIHQIDSLTNVLYNKQNQLFNDKGLVLAKEILARSKDINYSKGQIKSLVKIVDITISQSDFRNGYNYLKTLKKISYNNKDYNNYVYALGIESKLYRSESNFNEAIKILNSAKNYLPYIKNKEERINSKIITNIYLWYTIYNNTDNRSKDVVKLRAIAQELYDDSSSLLNIEKRKDKTLMACNLLVCTLTLENNFKEAYDYLKEAENYINDVGIKTFVGVDYLKVKADLLYKDKERENYNVDEILQAYQYALKIGEALDYHANNNEIYPIMAKLYGQKKHFTKQVYYLEKANASQKRLSERNKKGLKELREALYTQTNSSIIPLYIQNDSLVYWLLLLIATTPACYYGYKYINRKQNKDYNNPIMEDKSHATEDKPVVVHADHISHLLTLAHEKNNSFLVSFMSIFPDFSKSLLSINSTMKNTDIEFCAYIKLNLNTKQIAVIKNMSVRAVEGKKYRIRKKLDIPTNENMYLWISKI